MKVDLGQGIKNRAGKDIHDANGLVTLGGIIVDVIMASRGGGVFSTKEELYEKAAKLDESLRNGQKIFQLTKEEIVEYQKLLEGSTLTLELLVPSVRLLKAVGEENNKEEKL